jgi:hypothetical protein
MRLVAWRPLSAAMAFTGLHGGEKTPAMARGRKDKQDA